jgi:hypothetical protein
MKIKHFLLRSFALAIVAAALASCESSPNTVALYKSGQPTEQTGTYAPVFTSHRGLNPTTWQMQ